MPTIHRVDDDPIDPVDLVLAKEASDALERHYPGWGWMVHVNSEGGVVYIKNGVMSGAILRDYGYVFKIANINWNHGVMVKKIVTAGGEFLERAGVGRGPYKGQDIIRVEGVEERFQPIRAIAIETDDSIVL